MSRTVEIDGVRYRRRKGRLTPLVEGAPAKPVPPLVIRPHHPVGTYGVIMRHHHGWLDGHVGGTVTAQHPRAGGSCGYKVAGDDGYEYELDHTRDLTPREAR